MKNMFHFKPGCKMKIAEIFECDASQFLAIELSELRWTEHGMGSARALANHIRTFGHSAHIANWTCKLPSARRRWPHGLSRRALARVLPGKGSALRQNFKFFRES